MRDALILIGGVTGTIILGSKLWQTGVIVGFSVGHFFLFCNVFRIERRPELYWAALFILLTTATVVTGFPGWMITLGGSLGASAGLIVLEMRKPSYHGIVWKRINPNLHTWWQERQRVIPLKTPDGEERTLAVFVIAFGLTIAAWACAHDLHLISVEPRHFTAYHRPLLPISNHGLLAIQYAIVATLGPGMAFGALTFAVCRLGSRPQLSLRFAWWLLLPCLTLIEATALLSGMIARHRYAAGQPSLYPASLYPDASVGIAYSQSVNITTYLAAIGFGLVYLTILLIRRRTGNQLINRTT